MYLNVCVCSERKCTTGKKKDDKNQWKIKFLRLTFCLADLWVRLGVLFSNFFFFYRPIQPPLPSVLCFCFLPPSLGSSIRSPYRSHGRIIVFNMVSERRRLSWQIHYWLALTRTYSSQRTHTTKKLSKGENRGGGVKEERTRCPCLVKCLCVVHLFICFTVAERNIDKYCFILKGQLVRCHGLIDLLCCLICIMFLKDIKSLGWSPLLFHYMIHLFYPHFISSLFAGWPV